MRINSIFSIFSFFCPAFEAKKAFTFTPPSLSSIQLSSRSIKILAGLGIITLIAAYKLGPIAYSHFYGNKAKKEDDDQTKNDDPAKTVNHTEDGSKSSSQRTNPETDKIADTSAAASALAAESAALALTLPHPMAERGVTKVQEDNLRYLITFFDRRFDQRTIPAKCREKLLHDLVRIAREDETIVVPNSTKLWMPLLCILETARKDIQETNRALFDIIDNILFGEISTAIQVYIGDNYTILSSGKKSAVSADDAAEMEKKLNKLSPPKLIALSRHFLEAKSIDKAAKYYQLGLLRMKKDRAFYDKHPGSFNFDRMTKIIESIDKVKLSGAEPRKWREAKDAVAKEVEALDAETPHDYDWRWVIHLMLMDLLPNKTVALHGGLLNTLSERGMALQRLCIEDFDNDPRFQLTDNDSLLLTETSVAKIVLQLEAAGTEEADPVQNSSSSTALATTTAVEANSHGENLQYMQRLFEQRNVPAQYRDTLASKLSSLVKEEATVDVRDLTHKHWLPLLCVFETARNVLIEKNPDLHRISKSTLEAELNLAIQAYHLQYSNFSSAADREQMEGCLQMLPPTALISLCCHFLELKSFDKAAECYQLGLHRMRKDLQIYNKYFNKFPGKFNFDHIKFAGDAVAGFVDALKLKSKQSGQWYKATKKAEKSVVKLDAETPYEYDCRWVIFDRLLDGHQKAAALGVILHISDEDFLKLSVEAVDYQSLVLEDFAADLRFQLKE